MLSFLLRIITIQPLTRKSATEKRCDPSRCHKTGSLHKMESGLSSRIPKTIFFGYTILLALFDMNPLNCITTTHYLLISVLCCLASWVGLLFCMPKVARSCSLAIFIIKLYVMRRNESDILNMLWIYRRKYLICSEFIIMSKLFIYH